MSRRDAAWVLLSSPLLVIAVVTLLGCCVGVAVDAWREHRR